MELNEKEFADGSGLDVYTARYRGLDVQIGRWWQIDPKPDVEESGYAANEDNLVMWSDPEGDCPHPIYIRSFAPFEYFGGGFHGDDRTYSTSTAQYVTSRLAHRFTVDPSARTYNAGNVWSDDSYHPDLGRANATKNDKAYIKCFTHAADKNGNSIVTFTTVMAGSNPLVPMAPDIDVHTRFALIENEKAGTFRVIVNQTGDAFPAAETLIGDTKGNRLFIGVSPAIGTVLSLIGDTDRKMMSADFTITMDSEGGFTGVRVGSGDKARTYSISQWNEMMRSKPTTK
ncbi:MAG: hypothetical protein IMW88_01220 [Thermoflavifilum sp.]|uniref:hypothetical protein n=1 Tax=Thermoflavifilum sp. TaxID=1968839 RepID=UPI0018A4CFCB|nr:hypothetical protein [Thermoflavifilum sp.]QOR76225.1 MAG: hypothetical protein IMW88_01220 [Thermoflavifilum sp.]